MNHELIIVLDFGGQYNQLIARRVREFNVYCEVKSFRTPIEEIKRLSPKGIIFTGGPNSVYDPESPHIDKEIFELGIPVLVKLEAPVAVIPLIFPLVAVNTRSLVVGEGSGVDQVRVVGATERVGLVVGAILTVTLNSKVMFAKLGSSSFIKTTAPKSSS